MEHLRAWMVWAHQEPEPVAAKAERLRGFRRHFEAGDNFNYGMFHPDDGRVLGGIGLHRRVGHGAAEIGYWVHADHTGKGFATEATAALTRIGFEVLGLARMEIHCDPTNTASVAVPPKLGYGHHVTVPAWLNAPDMTPRDTMFWTMLRADYPDSKAAAVTAEAFDADGDAIELSERHS